MLVRTCCCQAEPATAPAAAGSPTSAAYPTSTSPRSPKTTTPAEAVIAIARSEVAVAARSGSPATRMSSGTAMMPPPTPKNAEKTPAASPMATRRTCVSYEHGQSGRSRRDARVVAGAIATGSAARQPPTGTAMYVVRHDLRLCPSPMCGGYWVALANGARTRCARRPAETALLRRASARREARTCRGHPGGVRSFAARSTRAADDFGVLLVSAVYAPAGRQRSAAASTASSTTASAVSGRRASRPRCPR